MSSRLTLPICRELCTASPAARWHSRWARHSCFAYSFGLGTRQITSIDWDDSDAAISAAIVALCEKMQGWKVDAGLIDTSAEQAREVIDYVVKHHLHHAEGKLRGLYNGLELRIEISYRGQPNCASARGAPTARSNQR